MNNIPKTPKTLMILTFNPQPIKRESTKTGYSQVKKLTMNC